MLRSLTTPLHLKKKCVGPVVQQQKCKDFTFHLEKYFPVEFNDVLGLYKHEQAPIICFSVCVNSKTFKNCFNLIAAARARNLMDATNPIWTAHK